MILAFKPNDRDVKFSRDVSDCGVEVFGEGMRGIDNQFYGVIAAKPIHRLLRHFSTEVFSVGAINLLKRAAGGVVVSPFPLVKSLDCYASFCRSAENQYHFLNKCLKLWS